MKVINYGRSYEIYEDDLKTFDNLPPHTYRVSFNPMSGFSLKRIEDYKVSEDKVYGEHEVKLKKVTSSFNKFERSLGVILSGAKGIGKSMFTQMLANSFIEQGRAVIVVDTAYRGIATFLESIDQEVLVLFDEFEKVFAKNKEGAESQDALLGLFDGTSHRKRLYAITVNNLNNVSEFMVNRTGRFHYHFRFEYPTGSEVQVYLEDKVENQYREEIKAVVAFSRRVKLNFDSLRAIAFELNTGSTFREAIKDLNIINTSRERYNIKLSCNGSLPTLTAEDKAVDLFANEVCIDFYIKGDCHELKFDPRDLVVDGNDMVIKGDSMSLTCYHEEDIKDSAYHEVVPSELRITQSLGTKLHYNF